MPELPDLVHMEKVLRPALVGRTIVGASVRSPVVLRLLVLGDFPALVSGRRFSGVERHGPFLRFGLEAPAPGGQNLDLVMHLMLAGRLRLAPAGTKSLPFTAFVLALDDGSELSYADEKNMGRIYLAPEGGFQSIPGYASQGVDLTGDEFTYERFSALIAGRRCQARVFVMDQTALSAVGNAYADEILFEAGIHPKAACSTLTEAKRRSLYDAIKSVLAWGVDMVEAAGAPLEDKVRGHMRVRNRAGSPCPRCGATIRKAGVLGFDAFFCPVCQPDATGKGLPWASLPPPPKGGS